MRVRLNQLSVSVCQKRVESDKLHRTVSIHVLHMIEIVTHLPDRSPSHDGSLAWLFIFTFGEGLFLALFFCAPFFPLFGGCLYFHLQAMLHSSVTAKPRHCAWCLYMHVWQHKTLGSGFMLMWQKSKRGFTPNSSLMCLTNCGSHSQHPSPNTLWFHSRDQH